MEMMQHTAAQPIDRQARLVVTPHPLTTQGQTSTVVMMAMGESLASVLFSAGVDDGWVVELDGLQVPALMWGRTRVKHGVVIECRRMVHDNNTFRIVAFATLAYFTMGTSSAFSVSVMAGGGLTGTIAGALAFYAGAQVLNRVLPPAQAAMMNPASNNAEPTYSLSGGRNSARLWESMGLVLGQPYCVPDLAGQPWSYFNGEDQYLTQIFHAGLNCNRVDTLRIGQTSIDSFQGVFVSTQGMPDTTYATGLPSNSVDTIAGALLDAPSGTGAWVTRTTSVGTIRIGIDFEMTLFGVNSSNGAYESRLVELDVQYSVHGSGNWVPVDTQTSYQESYLSGFTGSGLLPRPVYSWRTIPAAVGKATYQNATSKPLRVSILLPVASGQYDVRVRKVTANETSTSAQNVATWTQLKSFQPDLTSYPGQALVALNIKASGQLTGSLDQLNWMATARPAPYWNGSAWVTATVKLNGLSNPGVQLLQLARGIYDENNKLIAGLGWADSRIDIESLKAFMVWCAAKQFTFDAIIQQTMSIGDLMDAVAYAGMGSISWASGKFGVQWLADDAPTEGVINMGNIKAKSFSVSYATATLADEIEYGYFDASANNQWNSLRVQSPAVTTPINTARLSNMGITTQAQAAALARYAMAQNIYMSKAITFDQDLEFLTYKRGTVLALSHDLTQWGYSGRVQAAVNNSGMVTLTLDDTIPAPASGSAYIGLRLAGEVQYRIFTVTGFAGTTRTVSLQGTWPTGVALPGATGQAMDALWIYDFKATPGQKVVVSKIEPGDNQGGAKVTVTPLPDAFWPYVLNGSYTPATNNSLIALPAVSDAFVTEVLQRQGTSFYVDLTCQYKATGDVSAFEIWGSVNGGALALLGSSQSLSFNWRGGLGETWNIEVRPKNSLGQFGTAVRVSYAVAGLTVAPSNVDGLGLSIENNGVRISWNACADLDYAYTVVRIGSSWETGTEVLHKSATSHLLGWRSVGPVNVFAKHVDTTGNESAVASTVSLTIAQPPAPAELALSFGTANIEAKWIAPTPSSSQQALDRVELSWTSDFAKVIDGRKSTTTTFGWLPVGAYVLYARYVDMAGNAGVVAQAALQVLPPSAPVMTAVDTQFNAVTLRWQDARTSQPIRKYAIWYADSGTSLANATLYGSAGSDSRSDILFYRSSGTKVAYLVAEDMAGNQSAPCQIDLTVTMPTNFVLATEYYESWDSIELTNGVVWGGASGQIVLPANSGRTWAERLSNSGWTNAQQKVDAGFPLVIQPVPTSGKHVEQHDLGKLLASGIVRVTPTVQSLVAGCVPTIRIRGSNGDTSAAWQPWLTGDSASFTNFRYIEIEYSVTSDGKGFVVLDDLYVKVEIAEVNESTALVVSATDTAGTVYVCAKPFLDVKTAQATALGSSNIAKLNVVIDDATLPAKVYVQAWDTSNNRTSGTVSLYITGV